jgi:dimethylhistidine N-methyltransferase
MTAAAQESLVCLHDLEPKPESFREAVLAGLVKPHKEIPCKFFYDQRGSRLFEQICDLEEYYPTRTEIGILEAHGADMARFVGPGAQLIEFGSGTSRKVRILLDAMTEPAAYIPIDISKDHLIALATAVARDYPGVEVVPVCADYTEEVPLPEIASDPSAPRVGFFPGSSVGNFAPARARAFLERVAALVGSGGRFLIATDLKKDRRVLDAAYNDARGLTAAFNLNLLRRANRELGADFDLDSFRHHAFYNEADGRIEMHLVSRRAQTVRVAGRAFDFAEGESIHTENSYKFEIEGFLDLAREAGFAALHSWTDSARYFAVHGLEQA